MEPSSDLQSCVDDEDCNVDFDQQIDYTDPDVVEEHVTGQVFGHRFAADSQQPFVNTINYTTGMITQ